MIKHLPLQVSKLFVLLLLAVNFIAFPAAYAQDGNVPPQRNCAAMEILEQQMAANPQRAQALQSIEAQAARFIQNQQSLRTAAGTTITIPVVVHVVYNNSTQNISNTQIRSQIAALNQDFRRTNADANNTWSQAADVEIEFALATVNPMGTSTLGITRTATAVSSFNTNDAMKKKSTGGKDPWPTNHYLNIWVCNLSGNVLGYAQFPGGNGSTDGVVIGYKYFGTTGTAAAPFHLGRTTTHEVGHWLNLRHIWGDGDCSVDDEVSDTPLSDAPNYGCATGHVSCNTVDMVQNYMDYSDDACMNLFTAGQKSRMQSLFASGGARSSLLNSPGLGGGTTPPPTCSTNEVKLKLVLDNYPAETSWELKSSSGSVVASGGGYNSNGGTFNETFCLVDGCYDFVIRDTDGDGICCTYGNGSYSLTNASGKVLASGGSFGASETKNFCLGSVSPPPPTCPSINFNSYSISGFADQDIAGSHQVQDSGTTLFLSGNTWKQIPYTYTVTANTVLEFEYRSTKRGEIQGIAFENDNTITPGVSFKVYGGQSWGIANYNDYSGTEWKKYTIPVGNFYTGTYNKLVFIGDDDRYSAQTSYFRNVKIFESSCGNTRLADLKTREATILGTERELAFGINLYPNPARDLMNIELRGTSAATATLYDLTGKRLWSGSLKEHQKIEVNVSSLPAGIYTLRAVGQDGETTNHKFIKH